MLLDVDRPRRLQAEREGRGAAAEVEGVLRVGVHVELTLAVGGDGDRQLLVDGEVAIGMLRQTPAGRDDLVRALEHAVSRRTGVAAS